MDLKRIFLAFIIAFVATCGALFLLVPYLKKKKAGQEILCYVKEHESKRGTPTMGGTAFLACSIVVSLLFIEGRKNLALLALAVYFAYGATGFLDDFIKLHYKRNLGLRAYQKIILQLGIALILAWFCYENALLDGNLVLPFSKGQINIGAWIIPVIVFVFLAASNGVNLTDGLDGLATSTCIVYLSTCVLFLCLLSIQAEESGRIIIFEEYGNLAIVCSCAVGALMGFLLFNCFPAKIFMGDTGSLALGALCGGVLILSKLTLLVPFLGVMFVVSCVSVILQVASFKIRKKRILLKAPYHHHLQLKGVSETRIGVIYSTITAIVALICFVCWF